MHSVRLFSSYFDSTCSFSPRIYLTYLNMHGRWWKEFLAKSKMTFVRDRIVETYFWMNGACYHPPYSRSRIIQTKITSFITIIDDMFDTYGTTEECMKFVEAIGR